MRIIKRLWGYNMKIYLNGIDILQYTVLKADKSKATAEAVALLRCYLKKTAGKEKEEKCGHNIIVGVKKGCKKSERIEIRLDKDLYILGHSERSVYYAVSEFLERYLGWRFYNAKNEKNVLKEDIFLTPFSFTFKPKMVMRYNYAANCFDPDTMHKQKCNFVLGEYKSKELVAFNSIDNSWGHSYFTYIPPQEFFESNPEFFSMNEKGERESGGQLCLSNDKVFDIVYSRMREKIQKQPFCEFVNFAQNDNGSYCKCPKCREINEKYQSDSSTNLLFVKRLAEKLGPEFPHINVMTFAYQWSEKPPVGIEIPKNVYIFQAIMNKCLEHKLTDKTCRFNPGMLQYMYDWAALTENVFLWAYTTDFAQYALGVPKLIRIMYEDFQIFKKVGIKGIMFQGSGNTLAFADLHGYLGARLSWNNDLTYIEYLELIKEYLQMHFGNGWLYVFEYINLTCEQPISTHCYNPYQTAEMNVPYDKLPDGSYDKTYINLAKELLDKAYQEAENKTYKNNVDFCKLAFEWYVAEVTHEEALAKSPIFVKQRNKKLYKKLRKHNIQDIAEGQRLADESEIDFLTRPHEWRKR